MVKEWSMENREWNEPLILNFTSPDFLKLKW